MCQCIKKKITFSCLHRTYKLERCWRDDWRSKSSCLSIILPKCDTRPKTQKKKRFGFCDKCATYFGLPQRPDRYDEKYVERFLKYKEENGWAEEEKNVRHIPLGAVLDEGEMTRIQASQQKPTGPSSGHLTIDSLDLAATGGLPSNWSTSTDSISTSASTPDSVVSDLKSCFSISDSEISLSDDESYEMDEMMPQTLPPCHSDNYQMVFNPLATNDRSIDLGVSLTHGRRMLDLYRNTYSTVSTELTVDTDMNKAIIVRQPVPRLAPPPHRRKGNRYFQFAEPSAVPPRIFSKVYTGHCNEHGDSLNVNCYTFRCDKGQSASNVIWDSNFD
ncbi:hypothetical protein SCAR479_03962 [Seiridium cardinale]|uniref:Uncharacterized protein n=1 Tax=Seiridium cardinale TaxID=138064 RepID=A0ABR2XZW0_9PEZI